MLPFQYQGNFQILRAFLVPHDQHSNNIDTGACGLKGDKGFPVGQKGSTGDPGLKGDIGNPGQKRNTGDSGLKSDAAWDSWTKRRWRS